MGKEEGGCEHTDHDHKRENIIQYDSKRRGEFLEAIEVGTLHDAVRHCLDNESRDFGVIVNLIHPNEGLQEADTDDDQEGKEDQTLLHHHL